MSRHIPVSAKHEVLRLYRLCRPGHSPYHTMESLLHRFAVDYTVKMSNGDKRGRAQRALDRYRAARWYLYGNGGQGIFPLNSRVRDREERLRRLASLAVDIEYHQRRIAECEAEATA